MYKNFEKGRSMIEMLGVLAIIAVLSVGGIAGYSKAMEKYKVNKAIEGYSYLIQNLLEYKPNFAKSNLTPDSDNKKYLAGFIKDANIVPENWKSDNYVGVIDSVGNKIVPFWEQTKFVIDIYLNAHGNAQSASYQQQLCVALFTNLAYSNADVIPSIVLFYTYENWKIEMRYNNSNYKDENAKCFSEMTTADVSKGCRNCLSGNGICSVTIIF